MAAFGAAAEAWEAAAERRAAEGGPDIPLAEAVPCFRGILGRRAGVVVRGLPKWDAEGELDGETCCVLVGMLLDMLARPELSFAGARVAAAPLAMEGLLRYFFDLFPRLDHRAVQTPYGPLRIPRGGERA